MRINELSYQAELSVEDLANLEGAGEALSDSFAFALAEAQTFAATFTDTFTFTSAFIGFKIAEAGSSSSSASFT